MAMLNQMVFFEDLLRNGWTAQHRLVVFIILNTLFISICSGVFDCDFDDSAICGFTQDTSDDLNFLHHSGPTPTRGTGPTGDHTSGSGHYMYMEATGSAYGDTARLISPRFNGTGQADTAGTDNGDVDGIQVTFWVHMNGEEMGSLRVLVMNATSDNETSTTTTRSTTMQLLTSVDGVMGSEWVEKSTTVPHPSRDFHIVFEANCGASPASDIAIDDVTVNDDVVFETTDPPPIEEFNCTFEEQGLCVFTQSTDDEFDLVKSVAGDNENRDAMKKDHTFGNATGQYISVDAFGRYYYYYSWVRRSDYQTEGETARIVSPMLVPVAEGEEPACLLFWYHMHGDDVGDIRVYVKNETSQGLGDPVWYLSGERGNVWRAAEVRIEQSLKFQIVFEFVAGRLENLAIDDVSLSRYECPGEHPVALEPNVNCDFSEAEICFYTHDPTGNFEWVWTNRATDSRFTGPAQDHTRGDELGFYMHVDSFSHVPGAKARLISPLIESQQSGSCVEFWYHMYGSHIGRLNVYAKFNDSALPRTPTWTLSGNQGNTWHRAEFLANGMTRDFVVGVLFS